MLELLKQLAEIEPRIKILGDKDHSYRGIFFFGDGFHVELCSYNVIPAGESDYERIEFLSEERIIEALRKLFFWQSGCHKIETEQWIGRSRVVLYFHKEADMMYGKTEVTMAWAFLSAWVEYRKDHEAGND